MSKSDHNPLNMAAFTSCFLAALKFVAFLLTGSVVVLSSFLDSVSDSLVSALNAYFFRLSRKKPDQEHPYGHGGFEVISSLAQGIIIATFAVVVLFNSTMHLISGGDLKLLQESNIFFAVGTMVFSAFSGAGIQWMLARQKTKMTASGERSLSIDADRAHYLGDFWVNIASAAGLTLVWLTALPILDALFGFVGGLLLLRTSFPVLKRSIGDITHQEISPQTQQEILELALKTDHRIVGIHNLRSRRLGPTLFIDFHLKLPAQMPLEDAHDLGDRVVDSLKKKFPRLDAIIHLDPDTEPDDQLY